MTCSAHRRSLLSLALSTGLLGTLACGGDSGATAGETAGSGQGAQAGAAAGGQAGAGAGTSSGKGGSSGKAGATSAGGASGKAAGGTSAGGASGNAAGGTSLGGAASGGKGGGAAGGASGASGKGSGAGGTGSAGKGSGGNGAAGSGAAGGGGGALKGTPVGAFVGVNAFIDDPLDKMKVAGVVREYHNWSWCEGNGDPSYPGYPNNQLKFDLGFWNFDTYYQGLHDAGILVFPAVEGSVPWLNSKVSGAKPVKDGASTTDPKSYVAHADHMFQYAARYGSAKVDAAKLKLASGQKSVSGLGVLSYFEDWNEEDAWWGGPDIQFSPDEYAAMASADYDGHQGALGTTFGVKNADPNAKLVFGGLSGKGDTNAAWVSSVTGFFDGVAAWAAKNRGGSFPSDVLNVHHYAFSGNGPALSPEAAQTRETLAELVAYRDQKLPGKELWITEFGYDTNQGSVLRAPPIGGKPAPIVQADWLVRSFLAALAAGVDRATMYMLRDVDPSNTTQFASSGLVGPKGDWTPKPSFYFVYAFRTRLGAMVFDGEATSGDPKVRIYRFRDPSGGGAYVAWCPTSDDSKVTGYSLAVSGATSGKVVHLVDKSQTGAESPATITGGAVHLDVGETPTIVLVDKLP